MKNRIVNRTFLLFALVLAVAPILASAQDDPTPKLRLRKPATVRGLVGGESHDSYVIRARRGQIMTVRISWRREGDNTAAISISKSDNFYSAEPVGFGEKSANGKLWSGRIPTTGDYYIYVTAHPTANYTLRIALK